MGIRGWKERSPTSPSASAPPPDPCTTLAQLKRYTAAVREEVETSVRVEPGVLAIYAVAEKDDPSRFRFFEMYADDAAYDAHIASAHFRKYAETTKDMITSKKLIETVPIQLSAKPT